MAEVNPANSPTVSKEVKLIDCREAGNLKNIYVNMQLLGSFNLVVVLSEWKLAI